MPAIAAPQRTLHPTLVPASASRAQAPLRLTPAAQTAPSNADPLAADPLAAWQLGACIGSGGASEVRAGVHPETGEAVAVKILRRELRRQRSMHRIFAIEARVPGMVRHPSIPSVLASGVLEDGRAWFAMPRIEGEHLSALLAQPVLDTDRLRRRVGLLIQVARAVGGAHRAGVVHADLKPSNVLVDADDRVWVIDWGLARTPGAAPVPFAAGTVAGTLGWMSPEQARGDEAQVGPAADIWALGCMLWCLLHGSPPHAHDDPIRGLRRTVRAQAVGAPPDRLDPACRALWRVAARCLEPDPTLRFSDGCVLADVLGRWMGRTARGGNRPTGTLRGPGASVWAGTTLELVAAG